ncbi:MAG: hypothetical protein V4481_05180 [Patescibacteria group bacterium]
MKLEFERKPKIKMVGIRLTDIEYSKVSEIAKVNSVPHSEACRQLIRAGLRGLKLL